MENYKPNSHRSREEQPAKKTGKVITGHVKTGEQGVMHKIAENASDVKSYIIGDIIIPAVKAAVSDIVTNGIDIILYGEARHSKKSSSKVPYDRYYSSGDRYTYSSSRDDYNYKDIVFDSRGEAEVVLSKMDEIIMVYGMVSIADLYDLVGITGKYTDNKYGWTDLSGSQTVHVREGYMLKLPKVMPLN